MGLSALDYTAILGLVSRYCLCLDAGDSEGWVGTFTRDGILRHSGGISAGHTELRDFFDNLLSRIPLGRHPREIVHLAGLPRIHESDSGVWVETYCAMIVARADGELGVQQISRYMDRVVCVKSEWLLAEKTLDKVVEGPQSGAS